VPQPADSPRRTAALLALITLAGPVACTGANEIAECPGTEVGTFLLVGTRASASCQGDTAPADGAAQCAKAELTVDCQAARPVPACCFDGLFPPVIPAAPPFTFTITYGSQGGSAALCTGLAKANPYLGTRTSVAGGESLSVALDTAGAVLGACAGTCAVTFHHAVTGLVARDPVSGAATGFTGEYVETASATPSAACAPCATPCTATWTLGPPPPAPAP